MNYDETLQWGKSNLPISQFSIDPHLSWSLIRTNCFSTAQLCANQNIKWKSICGKGKEK